MSIKVLYTANDLLTLRHAGPCSQCNGISLFSRGYGCVRLVCIAPRRTSVDKDFKLPRNIGPIRWRNGYGFICPFILLHDFYNVIFLKALCCLMTFSASLTKSDIVIIYANGSYFVSIIYILPYQLDNFCSCTIPHGAAVYNQNIHVHLHTKPDLLMKCMISIPQSIDMRKRRIITCIVCSIESQPLTRCRASCSKQSSFRPNLSSA